MMKTIGRLVFGASCLAALIAFRSAHATPPVITINCATASHVADFQSCATAQARKSGTASYVTFSQSHFTIVNITAIWSSFGFGGGKGIWVIQSTTTTQANG
jgi:hypothetical protein